MKKFQIEKFYFRVYLTNVVILLGTIIAGIGFFYSNDMSIAMFGITMITTTVGIWMPSVKLKKSSNDIADMNTMTNSDIPLDNNNLSNELTNLINNGNMTDLLLMLNKINDNIQVDKMELGESMEHINELSNNIPVKDFSIIDKNNIEQS